MSIADPIMENPIHTRVVVRDDADPDVVRTAHCTRRGHLVPLAACATCVHLVSLPADPTRADAAVACRSPGDNLYPKSDVTERAARTELGRLVRRRVVCVEANASWETLEALLLDDGVDAVVVVDRETRPIGIVSKSDMMRRARDAVSEIDEAVTAAMEAGLHLDARPQGTAGDVMTLLVHTLPEDAPLSFAVALLALEDIEQIPVVSATGEVVGLLAARDVVRWFAQQMGYVVAPPGA